MGYWVANVNGLKWVVCLFWIIRVPEVYTRITQNKFGFLEVLPEIEFGYFGFGYFGFGFGYFGFGYGVPEIMPKAMQ